MLFVFGFLKDFYPRLQNREMFSKPGRAKIGTHPSKIQQQAYIRHKSVMLSALQVHSQVFYELIMTPHHWEGIFHRDKLKCIFFTNSYVIQGEFLFLILFVFRGACLSMQPRSPLVFSKLPHFIGIRGKANAIPLLLFNF